MTVGALAITVSACGRSTENPSTGVQLTIQYGEHIPAWLYVSGQADGGRFYGPNLLPDPPRPLAMGRETVLLELPEAMHGEVLSLSVTALDAQRVARMRGAVRAEVIAHTIQRAFISLTAIATCAGENSEHCGRSDLDAGSVSGPNALLDAGAVGSSDASVDSDIDNAPSNPDACIGPACITPGGSVVDSTVPELEPPDREPPVLDPPTTEPQEPPPTMDAGVVCSATGCITAMRCDAEGACDLSCPTGAHCTIDCGGAKNCHPICNGATCEIDCRDAERCEPICEGGASCEVICEGESCNPRCRGASQCLLRCNGEHCDLQCERDDERRSCEDEVLVCNRDCPNEA